MGVLQVARATQAKKFVAGGADDVGSFVATDSNLTVFSLLRSLLSLTPYSASTVAVTAAALRQSSAINVHVNPPLVAHLPGLGTWYG